MEANRGGGISERVRDHIRGNVVGYVAVFLALSGTAAALPGHDTVASTDIINREVHRADLNTGAVSGEKVRNDSLTGNDVDESTLDASVLQLRLSSSCDPGEAIRAVSGTGKVTCESTGPAGTITAVSAGAGLLGGGSSGAVELAVDPAAFQRRVSGACPNNSSVEQVNEDGTVACQSAVTQVTTGTGLSGGAITDTGTISINPAQVQSRVSGNCPGNGAIEAVNQDGTVACQPAVSQVNSGTGLTGGPITDTGTLSIDPTQVQSRVTGNCTGNQAIEQVNQNGSVACQSAVTQVSAGTGLSGGPITDTGALSVNPAVVQNRVTGTCTGQNAIGTVAQAGTVTCTGPFESDDKVVSGYTGAFVPGTTNTIISRPGFDILGECKAGAISHARVFVRRTDPGAADVFSHSTSHSLGFRVNTLTLAGAHEGDLGETTNADFNDFGQFMIDNLNGAVTAFAGSFYGFTNGTLCQFRASGISSVGQAP
jgi:hypothetical protein